MQIERGQLSQVAVLAALMGAACGGGKSKPSTAGGLSPCSLAGSVSGAATWSGGAVTCHIPCPDIMSGPQMAFAAKTDGRPLLFDVRFPAPPGLPEIGHTGIFTADIGVQVGRNEAGNWEAPAWLAKACTMVIEEHAPVGRVTQCGRDHTEYRLVGHGSCPNPAEPSSRRATGQVTIAPFRFEYPALYGAL